MSIKGLNNILNEASVHWSIKCRKQYFFPDSCLKRAQQHKNQQQRSPLC